MPLSQLDTQPALIDQVHDRLLSAIVDGTLAPGSRLTQDSVADMLGVSRQPVSHALQVLRRRGLLIDAGKRGVAVAPIDGARLRGLYQVREVLDGLAAELSAARVKSRQADRADIDAARSALARGRKLGSSSPAVDFVEADVLFHTALHALSGNDAIGETVSEQWPHFRRSMAVVLGAAPVRKRVWQEHAAILDAVLGGDVAAAGTLARQHARKVGEETSRRLEGLAAETINAKRPKTEGDAP